MAPRIAATAAEAVANIQDGATVLIGGFGMFCRGGRMLRIMPIPSGEPRVRKNVIDRSCRFESDASSRYDTIVPNE